MAEHIIQRSDDLPFKNRSAGERLSPQLHKEISQATQRGAYEIVHCWLIVTILSLVKM